MDCPNDRYVNDAAICQAVVGMLARVGIKVNLLAQPKAQYFAKMLKSGGYKTSFYLLGWTPARSTPRTCSTTSWAAATIRSPARRDQSRRLLQQEVDALTDKVLVETDTAKRDQLIKQAFEIGDKDFGYIPLHQQALAWGVSKKVKLVQRADNQVLFYWATKQD